MNSLEAHDFVIYNSPVGKLKIDYCNDSDSGFVTGIHLISDCKEKQTKSRIADLAISELEQYFAGKLKNFTVPIRLTGTDFQLKVWNELRKIPYGETRSYGEIAKAISNPKAARAVGMANNKNPIMIIVPCHRVIGANGKLVGYAGGIAVKQKLLEIEKNN